MRFNDEYFEGLIISQSNVLFTFGNVGSGKTCFFGHIVNHIYGNYLLELNRNSNLDGYRHCDSITKNMRKKDLPDKTRSGELKNVDFCITRGEPELDLEKTYFTYIDMPGDDLRYVGPNAEDITGNVEGGALPEHIEQFFEYDGINITIIGVIDYTEAEEQFGLFHQFLNHISNVYNYRIQKCMILVTKWDKSKSNENLKTFMEANGNQCLKWMRYKVDKWSAFPFSIGTVSKSDPQKLSKLDYSYCPDVLDWLIATSNINKLVSIQGEDVIVESNKIDEENIRIGNAFKFVGSTLIPFFSDALEEISKMTNAIRNIKGKPIKQEEEQDGN